MKIQDLIDPARVFLDLEAVDVKTAMSEFGKRLAAGTKLSSSEITEALIERERLGSTSVGDGFAIPHCKIPGLGSIQVALGRFATEVSFDNNEAEGVRFVFVVLSPPDQPALHLQILSQIARTLKSHDVRLNLLEAPDAMTAVDLVRRMADREGL